MNEPRMIKFQLEGFGMSGQRYLERSYLEKPFLEPILQIISDVKYIEPNVNVTHSYLKFEHFGKYDGLYPVLEFTRLC